MKPSLAKALRYQDRNVVDSFVDRYRVSAGEASALFADTRRWLWLNALPDAPRLYVSSELLVIDEMWHTFVLHTASYTRFCSLTFGFYLHHTPTTRREKLRAAREHEANPAAFARRRRLQSRRQYRFIAEKLGPEVLLRWYADYPVRYGRDFFAPFGIEVDPLDAAVTDELTSLAATG